MTARAQDERVGVCDRCLAASVRTVMQAKVAEPTARTDGARELRARIVASGQWARCRCEADYPDGLRGLADAPPVLYALGETELLRACPHEAIAMVGTRRPTMVGRDAARRIAAGVGRAGGLVVSGMAMGIDAAAHDGALAVGAPTIAVLGAGADMPSPPSNRVLYRRILDRGLVVSELPPGTPPRRWTFPARNRLIAGLSRLTLVVEAPARSGALITVEQATDLGRDIAAVPGSVAASTTEGSNLMLCDGAMAVIDGAALAAAIGLQRVSSLPGPADGPGRAVRDLLARRPLDGPQVAAAMAAVLTPGEAELLLLDLELAGWIHRRADGRYQADAAPGAGGA